MPNNKKQRARDSQKKKKAQDAARQKAMVVRAEAEATVRHTQAQQKAAEDQSVALLLQAQLRADLERKFGTPAIDEMITDIGRSSLSITAAAAAAAASKPASSSSSTAEKPKENVVCYHSSSAEHFDADSEFLQMVKSYVKLGKKHYSDDGNAVDVQEKFFNDFDHDKVLLDSEFTNFVFAVAVELYLKSSSEEREIYYTCTMAERPSTTMYELRNVIFMGLNIKYFIVPYDTQSLQEQFENRTNGNKYIKDIVTERGLINCLHREIRQYCNCMDSKKEEAKGMEKTERCFGCGREFLKELMKKCDGCKSVVYCSKDCQSNNWPRHQNVCEWEQKKLAANTMNHTDDDSDGGDDNEFDMNPFRDDDETLGDTTAVAPSSSSHITNNAMTNANANTNTFATTAAPFTSAGAHGNSDDLPAAAPARAAVADNAVPADENMINRGNNNGVEGNKNANGGAVDGAGGGDDNDEDDDDDDGERLARGIRSGGPLDFQSLVLDAKNAREEEPATTKGIVHGSCDGSVNIERFGHEEEEEIMTTKKVEAKAPPPHKNNTALKRNDDDTHGTSTRKEASIVMEGRNTAM